MFDKDNLGSHDIYDENKLLSAETPMKTSVIMSGPKKTEHKTDAYLIPLKRLFKVEAYTKFA